MPDGSREIVVCTGLLEHVPDPRATVAELSRILAQRISLQCDVFPPVRLILELMHYVLPWFDVFVIRQYDNLAKGSPCDARIGIARHAHVGCREECQGDAVITELSHLSTEPLRTPVAVVGSGPAGTEVATWLAGRGRQVTVLESGRDGYDPRADALNEVEFAGRPYRRHGDRLDFHEYLPPEYQGWNRLRQFGGTSCSWTGKWRAFEARDFEPRSRVPHSGWPVSFAEIAGCYAEAAETYDLGFGSDGTAVDDRPACRTPLREAGFKTLPFFQQVTACRSADRLRAAATALEIVLDATVVRIDLAPGSDRVGRLICRSVDGAERVVVAEHVVLASGGLETPRLLLASNHERPAGLGNGHDLVGRYYQDHLKINRAGFEPGPLLRRLAAAVQTRPRPRTTLFIGLPGAEQERLGILEASLFLQPHYAGKVDRIKARLAGRSLVRDGHQTVGRYTAKFTLEQAPNPDSRVRLAHDRDALGVQRLVVDWRLGDLDRRSFDVSAEAIARTAAASGFGRLDYGSDPADMAYATDSAHHMGTTRMGKTPSDGVVDTNCTVFGIPNLHVASSAVFPTGAGYSPTLTIVALARRLAKRLDMTLARPLVADAAVARSA